MATTFELLCIWNAGNEHLENAATEAKYRRCRKLATCVHDGNSFCDEHLAMSLKVQRETRDARWQAMLDRMKD